MEVVLQLPRGMARGLLAIACTCILSKMGKKIGGSLTVNSKSPTWEAYQGVGLVIFKEHLT